MKRRSMLQGLVLAAIFPAALVRAEQVVIKVYLDPDCGCCDGWVAHLRENGFLVEVENVADPRQYGEKFGVPEQFAGCHSAIVDNYALEGHVPARDIKRLLAERPKAIGLAVPGMPLGAPGMEGARKEAFDVLLIDAAGNHKVYSHYSGGQMV